MASFKLPFNHNARIYGRGSSGLLQTLPDEHGRFDDMLVLDDSVLVKSKMSLNNEPLTGKTQAFSTSLTFMVTTSIQI